MNEKSMKNDRLKERETGGGEREIVVVENYAYYLSLTPVKKNNKKSTQKLYKIINIRIRCAIIIIYTKSE